MTLKSLSHPQRIKATYFFLMKSPVQLTPGKSTLAELPLTRLLCLLVSSKSSVPPLDILDSVLFREEITHTQKTTDPKMYTADMESYIGKISWG